VNHRTEIRQEVLFVLATLKMHNVEAAETLQSTS